MPTPPAMALWMGPSHVLSTANAPFWAVTPDEALGLPASEAFLDPVWIPVWQLMDAVLASGRPAAIPFGAGELVIIPERSAGRIVGVRTGYWPGQASRLPALAPDPVTAAA